MKFLSPRLLAAVDQAERDREPTTAELAAIEDELPVIDAEVELLDVEISLMDAPRSDWADRRLRRAQRRVLAARTAAARRAHAVEAQGLGGAA